MSDTPNEALNQGGAAAPAPNIDTQQAATPAPRNDAEAQQQEAAAKAKQASATQEQEQAKKPNRTREFIDKVRGENRELRQQLAQYQQAGQPAARSSDSSQHQQRGQAAPAGEPEPTLEQHDFDVEAFTRAHSAWAVRSELQKQQTQQSAAATASQRLELQTKYETRVDEFADANPDFFEVVGLIKYPLSDEAQFAIMAHELGPTIAYHLGNNDDAAFDLASIQPHMAAAAVERLAKRLSAAPAKPEANSPPQQNHLAAPGAFGASNKPISQAPPPAPTVSGRSPTEVPAEKLTDDDWYKRDVERRRKR